MLICIDAHTYFFFVSQTHIFHFGKNFVHRDDISLFTIPTHTPHTHPKETLPSLPLRPLRVSLFAQPFYPHACTSVVPVLHPYFCSMFPLPTLHLSPMHTLTHSHIRHSWLFRYPNRQTEKQRERAGVCERKRDKKRVIISPIGYINYISGIKNKHRVKERNVVPGIVPGTRGTRPGTSCDARQLSFVQGHGVTGWDGRGHLEIDTVTAHSFFLFLLL